MAFLGLREMSDVSAQKRAKADIDQERRSPPQFYEYESYRPRTRWMMAEKSAPLWPSWAKCS
jgi:hypothetical protein